ncbi:MAG: tetratricopeptide repeat protein [Candidatus Obscuribacter sp.]|nr:tetratricopeptide repeat protein [Candidatus Obscuribacter sp.]MBK9278988.1 tetratricopeptide repeat protein [Candidatus Obscuribacter sp.]
MRLQANATVLIISLGLLLLPAWPQASAADKPKDTNANVNVNALVKQATDLGLLYGPGRRFEDLSGGGKRLNFQQIEALVKAHAGDPLAYVRRGNAYINEGDFELARKDFDRALSLDPKCAQAHIGKSRFYQFEQKWLAALTELDLAKKFANQDTTINILWEEAFLNRELKQYDRALSLFAQTLKIPQTDRSRLAYIYLQRGETYSRLHKLPEALQDYSQAIKINSTLTDAYFMRGLTYRFLDKPREAIADFTTVISHASRPQLDAAQASFASNLSSAYEQRAQLYRKIGNKELADRDKEAQLKFEKSRFEAVPFRSD